MSDTFIYTTRRKYIVDINSKLPTILCELDNSDDSLETSYIYADAQILVQYTHNDDVDETINERFYYVHDRLGSVRLMVDYDDSTDVVSAVNTYTYNPFGDHYAPDISGTTYNPWQFTGQYNDEEIDQYYLRARQYDPAMMRFTTRDPVVGGQREPLTLHKYLYCVNDPSNRVDPTGEFAKAAVAPVIAGHATHALAIAVVAVGVSTNSDLRMSLGFAIEQSIGQVMALVSVGLHAGDAIAHSVRDKLPKDYPWKDKNNLERLFYENDLGMKGDPEFRNDKDPDDWVKRIFRIAFNFLELFHNQSGK